MSRAGGLVVVAAIAALVVALTLVAIRDDGGSSSPAPAAERTVAAPPATVHPPAPALEDLLPGVIVTPVELGTYRISLVFRLRNAILNGLPEPASAYELESAQARRGSIRGLLLRVAAAPGAAPSHIPRDINRLVGVAPESRRTTRGRSITSYRLSSYHLAVVDGGPRQAVVAIAARRRQVGALADTIARALAVTPPIPRRATSRTR